MKYYAKVAGRELELRVEERDGVLLVELDGEEHRVDLATVEIGEKYSALVDHRSYAVSVDGDGQDLALIVSGRTFHARVEDERERALAGISGAGSAAAGVVESVMPGIVRRLDVEVGAEVSIGDRLLILEAMKMENEIRAEAAGVVSAVHVTEQQAVESGQPLVTIQSG